VSCDWGGRGDKTFFSEKKKAHEKGRYEKIAAFSIPSDTGSFWLSRLRRVK
jgi:hypothetical protein